MTTRRFTIGAVLLILGLNVLNAFGNNDANSSKLYKYYVSSSTGSDSCNGSNPQTAWKSFDKLNSMTLPEGSKIYLKRNDIWTQPLILNGSGSDDKRNILDAYGDGNKPVIELKDTTKDICVYGKDISNWTIKNLDLRTALRGLHVEYGNFEANNVIISDCNFSNMNYCSNDSKIYGIGLYISSAPGSSSVLYNPVIKNCTFTKCANGLAVWAKTQNLLCEDCFATKGLSAGVSVVNVYNGVIRRFIVKDVGGYLPYGTCAGFISFSNGTVIENCEFASCGNGGGHDGVGFDFEGANKNIIFRNNTLHDNQGAGIMVMSTSDHNYNITIKDCLLYNNCKSPANEKASYEMLCWNSGSTGSIENCKIYKAGAAGYIHGNYSNFTQIGNKLSSSVTQQ